MKEAWKEVLWRVPHPNQTEMYPWMAEWYSAGAEDEQQVLRF